jgi:hypothetical protein
MASGSDLTQLQQDVFKAVSQAKGWYRATRSGERVTLVSLYRRGLLERRAWRGKEGAADAAHEYRLSTIVRQEMAQMEFDLALKTHLDNPSKETWNALAHKIIPTTMRTVWQAWTKVDGGAPVTLVDGHLPEGRAERWPSFPDPFTTRRAIREALAGRVPVGLGSLLEERGPMVPR